MHRRQPVGFWQSVTGSLDWDETPTETAYRELYEETGLDSTVGIVDCRTVNRFPILAAWQTRYGEARENTEYVFRAELPRRIAIRLNEHEHSEYCWLPRQAAATRVSSYTNRDAILAWVPEPDDDKRGC